MVARTRLAILDLNRNVGREQAVTSTGTSRCNVLFTKQSKEWVAKKIYQPTRQTFTKDLGNVCWREGSLKKPKDLPDVERPPNIATKPKPPKEDVIRKHHKRFTPHSNT
ncbi:hypothetical protein GJAV_G00014220 [Gymnothorax javanicus]|nr:hypothetical protein GJAV_G00014220 [Gymnothorax javanicus]